MKFSNKMSTALNQNGHYSTNKYHYRLGWNMYGQEIVERLVCICNVRNNIKERVQDEDS